MPRRRRGGQGLCWGLVLWAMLEGARGACPSKAYVDGLFGSALRAPDPLPAGDPQLVAVDAGGTTHAHPHLQDLDNPHQVTAAQVGAATLTALLDHINSFDAHSLPLPSTIPNQTVFVNASLNMTNNTAPAPLVASASSATVETGTTMFTNKPIRNGDAFGPFGTTLNLMGQTTESYWSSAAVFNNLGVCTSNNTRLYSGTNYTGEWLRLDFGRVVLLRRYHLKPRPTMAYVMPIYNSAPATWYAATSLNGVDWKLWHARDSVYTWSNTLPELNWVSVLPTEAVRARYFEWLVTTVVIDPSATSPLINPTGRHSCIIQQVRFDWEEVAWPSEPTRLVNRAYVDYAIAQTQQLVRVGSSTIASTGSVNLLLPSSLPTQTRLLQLSSSGAIDTASLDAGQWQTPLTTAQTFAHGQLGALLCDTTALVAPAAAHISVFSTPSNDGVSFVQWRNSMGVTRRWLVTAQLRLRNTANPGGFEFSAWLVSDGASALALVRAGTPRAPTAMAPVPGATVPR